MIAIKVWSQATYNPNNIPGTWPWKKKVISEDEAGSYESLGWAVLTDKEYSEYLVNNKIGLDTWDNTNTIQKDPSTLKIYSLVQDKFKSYHPSKIDFTAHLKPNIYLQKIKYMSTDGRPTKSEYFYNNQKICEIIFEFETDQLNFMTRRTEKLGFVNGAGEIEAYYTIYDQYYSYAIETQFSEMIAERAKARTIIFDSIKAITSGYLTQYYMAQGQTYSQVLQLLGAFWMSYSSLIDSWINTGTPELQSTLTAETNFPLLDVVLPIQSTGLENPMSVRDYTIYRVTY